MLLVLSVCQSDRIRADYDGDILFVGTSYEGKRRWLRHCLVLTMPRRLSESTNRVADRSVLDRIRVPDSGIGSITDNVQTRKCFEQTEENYSQSRETRAPHRAQYLKHVHNVKPEKTNSHSSEATTDTTAVLCLTLAN